MLKCLEEIRKEMEEVNSGWNGEDDSYHVGGRLYYEEDAIVAKDIIEKIDELDTLIKEFNGTI